jgi:predicted transcriptional regulator
VANRLKLTFDLSDRPDLVEALRILAARQRTSQRAIIIDALQAFFAHRQENLALLDAANRTFSEWSNEEDRVYDSL